MAPRLADLDPSLCRALVGATGSLAGALLAWSLAQQEFYLLWTLSSASLLFLLGRRFPATEGTARGAAWLCGTLLRNSAGLLLTVAWLQGPSLLSLITAFWAFRLFAELRPAGLAFLNGREGGIWSRMADLSPGLWAFFVVMLPLRMWVEAPWQASAGVH